MKKAAHVIFALCFAGTLATFGLMTAFGPRETVSFYENRTLAERPSLSLSDIVKGETFAQFNAWMSDHVAWRDALLKANTWADLYLYRRPVVGGYTAAGDALVNFHGYGTWNIDYLKTGAEEMGRRLAAVNEQITAYGGYFCYLGIPQQYSYFSHRYPAYMDNRQWILQPTRAYFKEALTAHAIPLVEMWDVYESLGKPDEFFSAVDHHYTYRGMLAAYDALMARIVADTGLPLAVLTADDITVAPLPNVYLGSRTRALYGLWPSDEKLEIGRLVTEIPFTRADNGAEVPSTLYTIAPMGEPVTFTAYMGGDIGETILKTNRPELPRLLIFGDSFSNPLETVLWASFDETRSLDFRHYSEKSLLEYIEEYRPDVVICVRDDSAYLSFEGNGNLQ